MARQWAFADALKYVWYTTIPFGIISFIACLFLPNIKKYMTNRVAVVSLNGTFTRESALTLCVGHPLVLSLKTQGSKHTLPTAVTGQVGKWYRLVVSFRYEDISWFEYS